MEKTVELNEEYQILLCRLCNNAVRPGNSIEGHFRAHKIKGQLLRDIVDYYSTMKLQNPLTTDIPAERSKPVQGLLLLHSFRCIQCCFLTIARDNMMQHWRTAGYAATELGWKKGAGHYSDREKQAAGDSMLEKIIANYIAERKEEDEAQLCKSDTEEGIDRDSAWVKRLGWVRHFGLRDKLDIHRAVEWVKAPAAGGRAAQEADEEALRARARLVKLAESFDCEVDSSNWGKEGEESEKDSEEEEEEEEEKEESERGREGGSQLTGALDRAVFLFVIASIKQHVGGRIYANPLLCFSILWWAWLFFLEASFEIQLREREEVSIEAVLLFEKELAKWMFTGTYTIISIIIGWMAYSKGWRQQMSGQAFVRWSEDQQTLFHNGEQIAVQDFQQTACKLVADAEALLDRLLASTWAQARRELAMERIADSIMRLGAGQSFVTNAKNRWLEAGPGKVMQLIGPSVWDAVRNRWKQAGVKKWLRQLQLFREALLLLVHIWGGQLERGLELMIMRHSDSWQLIRNVFVLNSQVMLVTDCDKMKALCNHGRKVARFLLDQVGRMASTGVRMGIARYRLIAIEMKQRIRGLAMQQAKAQIEEMNENNNIDVNPLTGEPMDIGGSWNIVWDLQAMHSIKIAQQHYAVHIEFLSRLQPEMVATFRAVSRLWHQFLESRGEKKERGRTEEVVQLGKKRKSAALEEAEAPAAAGRKQAKTIAAAGRMDTDAEITAGLRMLLGPEAAWKFSEQAESMQTIMQLGPDGTAICMLLTGAGKSLLFIVPAVLANSGTSIVVVLFVALMEDLVAQAVAMSVDCIRYQLLLSIGRDGLLRAVRMVVASADLVSTAEFTAYADGLLLAGLLQRIFVDECYTAITDISYWARLGELKSLRRFGCPMVLLTATLLLVLESWFREEMLAQDAVAVQARTTKANCWYRVELVQGGRGAVQEQTVEIAQQLGREITGNQKGVVYCWSRQQCTAVAEELGCSFHHSGMSEEEQRAAREASWQLFSAGYVQLELHQGKKADKKK
ncbi:hypothetical protein M406DRAFT_75957 [Cryphonectria parasitica EP155]|uniref:C2H2-type domain-containing protein n=1 Tax=Cryphonectria parasitica (strain ATCC 38755 / EP155) TaxID=660469 RepID=A0A9P4XUH3_CRYP1|nr:uncharacterized protein M406DRAFT_75957 [Cryphonectria parasitica EP155]KAF3761218.1 hypothetical protein M406DRAFT_75957 [Cryphonectria parasitica EP155]